jgi:hypothetical protein
MKKKSEEGKLKAWQEAWSRRCPACKASAETPCRGSDGITLSTSAIGLPSHHAVR